MQISPVIFDQRCPLPVSEVARTNQSPGTCPDPPFQQFLNSSNIGLCCKNQLRKAGLSFTEGSTSRENKKNEALISSSEAVMIYLLSFESPLKGSLRLHQFLSILIVSSSADIWGLACYIWIWEICSLPEPGNVLALTSPARLAFAGPLRKIKTDESTSEAFGIAQNPSFLLPK